MNKVIIALGANVPGAWGTPEQTLRRAPLELGQRGIAAVSSSKLYRTLPVGQRRQPDYLNSVLVCRTDLPTGQLLRILKRIERDAGRRQRFVGGERPLDLDLIDHGGRVLGWPARRRNRITLPHPEAHRRAFVLVPLHDVAPHWMHPIFKKPGHTLLMRLPRVRGDVLAVARDWFGPAELHPTVR